MHLDSYPQQTNIIKNTQGLQEDMNCQCDIFDCLRKKNTWWSNNLARPVCTLCCFICLDRWSTASCDAVRAHLMKQWAAVSTYWLLISEPPQIWLLPWCILACQGHDPGAASSPPTIFVLSGAMPHTAQEQSKGLFNVCIISACLCAMSCWNSSTTGGTFRI